MRIHAGRQATAEHEPGGIGKMLLNSLKDAIELGRADRLAFFVQFDRQALAVGDRKVGPNILAYFYDLLAKAVRAELLFELAASLASRRRNSDNSGPETSEHTGRIDATSASGF